VITLSASRGDPTSQLLNRMKRGDAFSTLERWAEEGVRGLAANTPVDSGVSAESWTYDVVRRRGRYTIIWKNTNVINNTPLVIMLQYGHGTRQGGYVRGRDFINPVIQPLFDKIANEVWKEVTRG
jgi:hypothetical protein